MIVFAGHIWLRILLLNPSRPTNSPTYSNVVGIINAVLVPHMLNPTAWNWSNFTGFFWVSTIQPDSISGIAQQLLTCVPRVESVFSASSTRISDFPSPMVDRLLSSMSYLRSVLLRGNSPILRLMCLTRQLRARRWISTKTSIMAKLGKPR